MIDSRNTSIDGQTDTNTQRDRQTNRRTHVLYVVEGERRPVTGVLDGLSGKRLVKPMKKTVNNIINIIIISSTSGAV